MQWRWDHSDLEQKLIELDSHFKNYLSKSRAHTVCCEKLFDAGKRLLPEFLKYKFGGQLQPTNTIARQSFQAISGNQTNGVVKARID